MIHLTAIETPLNPCSQNRYRDDTSVCQPCARNCDKILNGNDMDAKKSCEQVCTVSTSTTANPVSSTLEFVRKFVENAHKGNFTPWIIGSFFAILIVVLIFFIFWAYKNKRRYDKLSSKDMELRAEIGNAKHTDADFMELKEIHDQVNDEHKKLKESYDKLNEDHKKLKEDHKKLNEDYKNLEKERNNILGKTTRTDKEYTELKKVYEKLKESNDKLCDDHEKLVKERNNISGSASKNDATGDSMEKSPIIENADSNNIENGSKDTPILQRNNSGFIVIRNESTGNQSNGNDVVETSTAFQEVGTDDSPLNPKGR